ncbi:MAG TPA: dTMP kinase, partial [Pyrinomonadaceae bacterium]|nr:dTMP kinase [Pyrinomonadaceae bacterium]
IDVLTTREPGGTTLGRKLREVFLESEETVTPLAELLLFAADRAQHVEYLIKPALEAGRTVISDRYSDATVAYQGSGRGFSDTTIQKVIELATGGLRPDLTLFFDVPIETALARTRGRDQKGNRMDQESAEFYERVREEYLTIGEREPGRFKVVQADGPIEEVSARVANIVSTYFG